jgi:hypothetical protein
MEREGRELRGDLDCSDAEVAQLRARIGRYYTVTRGLAGLAGIALLSVGLVQSGFWVLVAGIWIFGAVAIGINLASALLPVHCLIRDAKRIQLDWCRHALIRERTKLQEGGAERSRIDEIVAYRDVVEGVSAGPFDSSAAVRILLYLLIPLGSWAGGAIVERFVDSQLG